LGGIIGIIAMAGVGYLVGEAATRVARRRRGRGLGIVAALAVPLGLVAARATYYAYLGADPVIAFTLASATLAIPIWNLLGVVVGAFVAFSRLR
jgi:hypothetical protein